MRSIGMDVHRSFAQIAVLEDGLCRDEGRIGVRPEDLRAWAATLQPSDEVALEATTNSDAIAVMLRPLVARVVVSTPARPERSPRRRSRPTRSTLASWPSSWPRTSCPRPGSPMNGPAGCGGWSCAGPISCVSGPG